MNLWFNCWVSLKTFLILTFMSITQDSVMSYLQILSIIIPSKGLGEEPFSKKNNYHIYSICIAFNLGLWLDFLSCSFSIYKSGNPKKSREYPLFTFFFFFKEDFFGIFLVLETSVKYTLSTLFYECIFLFSACAELCKILFHMFKKPRIIIATKF